MVMPDPIAAIDRFPRVRLAHTPTPIESLANLSKRIGGARLAVKRDDCTGLAFGGNKVRQLEFYLGEARARGADTILITGAVQSNFVRLAAAAARKCAMNCHVQLEERVSETGPAYRHSGNVLLDRLLGATLHSYPDGEDEAGADRRLGEIAGELAAAGRRPYVIPLSPGHPPLGALGYIDAARELIGQYGDLGHGFDRIVVASGSGNTHAGLLFGLRALGDATPVTGVCVRRDATRQSGRIGARCREIAELLGVENFVGDADVVLSDEHLAPGYGTLNPAVRNALRLAGETEGLLLDPVYTGRAMAAALTLARQHNGDESILMIHTGGTPALFAYGDDLIGHV